MERLTRRTERGAKCAYDPFKCEDQYEDGGCGYCAHMDAMMEKLAAYEDAEEQGLLLRLPCKAKSVVYLLDHSFIRAKERGLCCEIDEFVIERNGCYAVLNANEPFYAMRRFRAVNISNFGETVFLTKEEAEKALAERGKG